MKQAVPAQYVFVERTKLALLPLVFVTVFAFAAGFTTGDMTAEPRFAEREASLREYVMSARAQADRVAESIRKGCFAFVDPGRPGSSKFMKGM